MTGSVSFIGRDERERLKSGLRLFSCCVTVNKSENSEHNHCMCCVPVHMALKDETIRRGL